MARKITPRRVRSWRRLLDDRLAGSVFEDQFCTQCDLPGEDPDCPACGGSGLVVPAGPGGGLLYPKVPWLWEVGSVVTFWSWSGGNVLGLTLDGKVVLGLFKRSEKARRQLQAAYRSAFGARAEEVEFVLPWEAG